MKGIYTHELVTGSGYLVTDIDETASPYYYGYFRPDGSWIMVKDTVSGSIRASRYLRGFGVASYDSAWANRSTQTFIFPAEPAW